ncbi:Hypothetical predicted protein [Podarcis lilfordi]|uniref:Uncharacterized protein n=1 Tax=Podarcis lilfordi TaxID=74358 RepID=A0AA35LG86_9SAUR|nr:Hypothetical predicted protein [Podarcis lilfordi]
MRNTSQISKAHKGSHICSSWRNIKQKPLAAGPGYHGNLASHQDPAVHLLESATLARKRPIPYYRPSPSSSSSLTSYSYSRSRSRSYDSYSSSRSRTRTQSRSPSYNSRSSSESAGF